MLLSSKELYEYVVSSYSTYSEAMQFTSKETYEYVFSTASIYSETISNGLYVSFIRLGTSLFNALVASLIIIGYVLILVTKLAVMIFPHLISTVKTVIHFHRTKLTRNDIIVEFSVATFFILFFLLRKRIASQWRIFEKSVAKKSKGAAEAAPHVVFFTFSLIVSIVGRKFLIHLTSPSVLPIVSLVIPMVTTLSDFRRIEDTDVNDKLRTVKRSVVLKRKLTLWVVLAAYHTMATGLGLIPFSAKFSSALPLAREIIIVVIIWAQISHKFGDILFDAAIPFLKYLSRNIPSSNFGATSGSSFISMLRMMRVINSKWERFLKSLQQDIVIVLITLAFLFSPWRIASIGVIIVTLLFPAFKSSNVILLKESEEGIYEFWLQYWMCWGVIWMLKCYGFKMWPSIMLLSTLWLQHSLFRGASVVFYTFGGNVAAVFDRHNRIQNERDILLTPQKYDSEMTELTPQMFISDSGALKSSSMSVPKRHLRSTPISSPFATSAHTPSSVQKIAVTGVTNNTPKSIKKERLSNDVKGDATIDTDDSSTRKNK